MRIAPAATAGERLTAGAEAVLWRDLRAAPSARTRQTLFEAYLPFARALARRLHGRGEAPGVEFGDLLQLACAGLLEAIDGFDPQNGTPFAGYAARRVRGSMLDGMAKMSEVSQQIAFRARVRQERARALAEARAETGQTDALSALIDVALGLALGFMLEDTALYVVDDLADHRPSPYDNLAWREMSTRLRTAVEELPPRERLILRQHYLEGVAFEQIARLLDLSKGRVSQQHHAGLDRLRKRLADSRDFWVGA